MKQHNSRCFSISYEREIGGIPTLRIIVPKRYVANAVERNKIKRWVRELFRSTSFVTCRGIQVTARLTTACKNCSYGVAKEDFKKAYRALLEDNATIR